MAAQIQLKPAHRKAVAAVMDSLAGPFRRSSLSGVLYPLTNPRSRQRADALADAMLRELSRAGVIQRHGHQHWTKVAQQRKLLSGREVPELPGVTELTLTTHCPAKWLAFDMETGDAWVGASTGWRRASAEERQEALAGLA